MDMSLKILKLTLLSLLVANISVAQPLKAGFDAKEYRELMYISTRTASLDTTYIKNIAEPKAYERIYRSEAIGLDNLWDLWINHRDKAVISIRGTTEEIESWLANFYAAMIPAKGELVIGEDKVFKYELASHPQAAVHVGWVLSLGFLADDIISQILDQYETGIKDILIIGHSQGGAIAYLLSSHLNSLQKNELLPADIRFKTYCSAAPKPGNLFYAYEFEAMTQEGWAYNVVNSADWVPEVPISIQTLDDFNLVNPFRNIKQDSKARKFPENIVMKRVVNRLDKPTKKARNNYQKYLGNMASRFITKNVAGYEPPIYFNSNNYVRTGTSIVLQPDTAYFMEFPQETDDIFMHHSHHAYIYLLDKAY